MNPPSTSASSGTTPTSTGLAPNVAGALSYLLGFITGIIFLVLEKENRFVRFHAAQSITVSVLLVLIYTGLTILSAILGVIPVVGWLVGLLLTFVVGIGSIVLWLLLMLRAFQGREWRVPVAEVWARKIVA
jgi:uncharacterized membrane protein